MPHKKKKKNNIESSKFYAPLFSLCFLTNQTRAGEPNKWGSNQKNQSRNAKSKRTKKIKSVAKFYEIILN